MRCASRRAGERGARWATDRDSADIDKEGEKNLHDGDREGLGWMGTATIVMGITTHS